MRKIKKSKKTENLEITSTDEKALDRAWSKVASKKTPKRRISPKKGK